MTLDTREDIKLSNAQIAWRAAQDIEDDAYVNLGIGFPEMVARFQPPGRQAIFHTENGILNLLVDACTFPLTGVGCITRVYTSHAVIDIKGGRFVVREKLAAMTMDELQAMTGAPLHTDGPVAELTVPTL